MAEVSLCRALFGASAARIVLNVFPVLSIDQRGWALRHPAESITGITTNTRLQLLLFFCLAHSLKARRVGTPVAVTTAIMMG
jgi:hypothetical protein